MTKLENNTYIPHEIFKNYRERDKTFAGVVACISGYHYPSINTQLFHSIFLSIKLARFSGTEQRLVSLAVYVIHLALRVSKNPLTKLLEGRKEINTACLPTLLR